MPSNKRNLLASSGISAEVLPEAVAFNGTTDYLSKSGALTGSADGKTFTFSCWVYFESNTSFEAIYDSGGISGPGFFCQSSVNNNIQFLIKNSSSAIILNAITATGSFPEKTWSNILVSMDLTNASNRYVYINDVDVTSGVTWTTYTDDTIPFTTTSHAVASEATGGRYLPGRLAHFLLDYTYRDLSIEANRRLFITADLKPSSTIPSSPILYLPLTDRDTAGTNAGTGGDFTINGNPQTASRGPNQDNCVASDFDGVADKLVKSDLGIVDTTISTFTLSHVLRAEDGNANYGLVISDAGAITDYIALQLFVTSISLVIRVASTTIVNSSVSAIADERMLAISMSIDLTDAAKRHIFINGVDRTADFSWSTYTTGTIDVSGWGGYVGTDKSTGYTPGINGEAYFDTTYTDLSTSNPFWDSDTNRPVSVRQVIEDTGITPPIALPIIGNDAGTNLGSGGDFTVNSGPYTGARGGSEFWARSMEIGAATSGLTKTQISTDTAATNLTFVGFFKNDDTSWGSGSMIDVGGSTKFDVQISGIEIIRVYVNSAAVTSATLSPADEWVTVLVNYDQTNISLWVNGTKTTTAETGTVDISQTVGIGNDRTVLGVTIGQTHGACYFADSLVDFDDADNIDLFVDRLGNPRDLTDAIAGGDIPNPIVYMKYDDLGSLETNSGTGGDFTVNGTIVSGADVGVN